MGIMVAMVRFKPSTLFKENERKNEKRRKKNVQKNCTKKERKHKNANIELEKERKEV